MPNVSSFGAQTDNAVVSGTVTDRQMIIPEIPPQGLMSVGPRVTPNFVKPREWNDKTTYHFFDAVRDTAGNAYVATKPVVPAGTQLTDEDYWFLWADPDTRFDDLNETVKTFNQRITQNTNDIKTKAPANHASEETIYGVGNELNYGHVRLAVDDTPMTSDANAGAAATPAYVHNAIHTVKPLTEVVYIGDSWGDPTSYGEWVKKIGARLGLTMHNYAVGGAGFVNESPNGKTFNVEVNDAAADLGPKCDLVKYVIVLGGVNDVKQNKDPLQVIAAAKTLFNNIASKFPNAVVHFFGITFMKTTDYKEQIKWELVNEQIKTEASNCNVSIHTSAGFWLKTIGGYIEDDTHPSTTGRRMLQTMVVSCINGGDEWVQGRLNLIPSENVSVSNSRLLIRNETIYGNTNFGVKSAFSLTTDNIISKYTGLQLGNSISCPCVINKEGVSGLKIAMLVVNTLGEIHLQIDSDVKTYLSGSNFNVNTPTTIGRIM